MEKIFLMQFLMTALFAAGAGAIRLRFCVLRTGLTAIRPAKVLIYAFVLFARCTIIVLPVQGGGIYRGAFFHCPLTGYPEKDYNILLLKIGTRDLVSKKECVV